MKRNARAILAKETVGICDAGSYDAPSGARVHIGTELDRAKNGTVFYAPENPPSPQSVVRNARTCLEVRNETTFAALARLAASGGHLACLNFASAKNPGGGLRNRANRSALYLDLAIFSPLVPFIRNDEGELLEKPILASIITAPAPNAGAIAQNEPANLRHVEPAIRRRAELVLNIAIANRVDRLVLGAWGCGVFRNDPRLVATIFAELLKPMGKFAGAFTEVAFAVYDRSENFSTFQAFADEFKGARE
jgi:hypothetical protein